MKIWLKLKGENEEKQFSMANMSWHFHFSFVSSENPIIEDYN